MHNRSEQDNPICCDPGDSIEDKFFSLLKSIDLELHESLGGIGGLPKFSVLLVREVEPKPFISVIFDGVWNPTVALPTISHELEVRYSDKK